MSIEKSVRNGIEVVGDELNILCPVSAGFLATKAEFYKFKIITIVDTEELSGFNGPGAHQPTDQGLVQDVHPELTVWDTTVVHFRGKSGGVCSIQKQRSTFPQNNLEYVLGTPLPSFIGIDGSPVQADKTIGLNCHCSLNLFNVI